MERTAEDDNENETVATDAPLAGSSGSSDSGHSSLLLGMGIGSDEEVDDDKNKDQPAIVISLEYPSLPPLAQQFWESTQLPEEPFTAALQEWLRMLEQQPKPTKKQSEPKAPSSNSDNEKKNTRRVLETPSAFAALAEATRQRNDFSKLVHNKGSEEQQKMWDALSSDDCEAVLSRLFLSQHISL